MPAINLTIRQRRTKTNLNDTTILDQRIRLEAQNTGKKPGVKAKQTNKKTRLHQNHDLCVFHSQSLLQKQRFKGLSLSRNKNPHTFGETTKRIVTKTFKLMTTLTSTF